MGAAELVISTRTLAFGTVAIGSPAAMGITFRNVGDEDCTFFSFVSSNPLFVLSGVPASIAVGDEATVTVTYTPTGAASDSATLTLDSAALENPIDFACTGTGAAGGSPYISLDPSAFDFGSWKVGETSDIKVFTIRNTGSGVGSDLTVTALTIDGPFTAAAPTPALPVTLSSGDELEFGVTFDPIATGYVLDNTGIHITSGAATSPNTYALAGTGYPITPAYSIPGVGETLSEVDLVGFRDPDTADPTVKQFDEEDWNCEESGTLNRWHDFMKPGVSKTYYQMFLFYEDRGEALISVNVRNSDASRTDSNIAIGTSGADDDLMMATAENIEVYAVSGQLETKITRGANSGEVSLVELIHVYDDKPRRGTVAIPGTITPVYVVDTDDLPVALFGFSDASVMEMDDTDFDTEEAASVTRDYNPTGPGYQSSILRLQVNYEDHGVASVTATVTTRRGQSSTQTNSLGTVTADSTILQKLFDLDIEDEVLTLVLSKIASSGPLVMTGMNVRFVDRGEVKK